MEPKSELKLRRGMWVATSEGLGITYAFMGQQCIVHLVAPKVIRRALATLEDGQVQVIETEEDNTDGETTGMITVPITSLVQAKLADIPLSRRPGKELAERLGYL